MMEVKENPWLSLYHLTYFAHALEESRDLLHVSKYKHVIASTISLAPICLQKVSSWGDGAPEVTKYSHLIGQVIADVTHLKCLP